MINLFEQVTKGVDIDKVDFEGVTMPDLGRAMYELAQEYQRDKADAEKGHKSHDEAFKNYEDRLGRIQTMVDKLRTDLPDVSVLTDRQAEGATRRGGLFAKGSDGKPVLKASEVLDISAKNTLVRGSDAERIQDFKDAYDAMVIRHFMEFARTKDWSTAQKRIMRLPDFQRTEKALEAMGYEKTLIHPASGGIAEDLTWVHLSSEILDLVRMRLRVASEMVSVPLVHHQQDFPANRGDAIGVLGGAATTDPPPTADITSVIPGAAMFSSVAFGLVNFRVEDVLGFLWWSDRAVTDTVISMVPYLREQVAFAIARAVDRACMSGDIQGQTQGNHMDDHASAFTVQDARTLWNGLRRMGHNYRTNINDVFDATDLRGLRKNMGIYGLDPMELRAWMSPGTLYDLMADPDVRTVDVFGPEATVKTGVLATVDGIQCIPTEWIPTDTADGYSTAVGTDTLVVLANVRRFMLGQLGGLQVETTRHAPMMTTIIQAAARYDMKPIEPTSSGIFAASGVSPVQIGENVTV